MSNCIKCTKPIKQGFIGPKCFKKYGLGEKLNGIPDKLDSEKYFLILKNSFINFSNITYEHENQKELVEELLKLQEEGFGNDDVEIIAASNKEEAKLKFEGHSAGLSHCKACNSSYCTVFDKKFEKNDYQEKSQKNGSDKTTNNLKIDISLKGSIESLKQYGTDVTKEHSKNAKNIDHSSIKSPVELSKTEEENQQSSKTSKIGQDSDKGEMSPLNQQNEQKTKILPDSFLWSPVEEHRKDNSYISSQTEEQDNSELSDSAFNLSKEDFTVITPIFKHHLIDWHYIGYYQGKSVAFRMKDGNQEILTIQTKDASQTYNIQLGLYNEKWAKDEFFKKYEVFPYEKIGENLIPITNHKELTKKLISISEKGNLNPDFIEKLKFDGHSGNRSYCAKCQASHCKEYINWLLTEQSKKDESNLNKTIKEKLHTGNPSTKEYCPACGKMGCDQNKSSGTKIDVTLSDTNYKDRIEIKNLGLGLRWNPAQKQWYGQIDSKAYDTLKQFGTPQIITQEIKLDEKDQKKKQHPLLDKRDEFITSILNEADPFAKGEKIKDLLKKMSQFHNYSINNQILAYLQWHAFGGDKTGPSRLAGFTNWTKQHEATPIQISAFRPTKDANVPLIRETYEKDNGEKIIVVRPQKPEEAKPLEILYHLDSEGHLITKDKVAKGSYLKLESDKALKKSDTRLIPGRALSILKPTRKAYSFLTTKEGEKINLTNLGINTKKVPNGSKLIKQSDNALVFQKPNGKEVKISLSKPVPKLKLQSSLVRKDGKPFFAGANVFDHSQVVGAKITNPADEEPEYREVIGILEKYCQEKNIEVKYRPDQDNSFGVASLDMLGNRDISVNDRHRDSVQVVTLLHEITHQKLHLHWDKIKDKAIDEKTQEIQAEGTAFYVSSHFGFRTDLSGDYMNYLGATPEELRTSFKIIAETGSELINYIEKELYKKYETSEFSSDTNVEKEIAVLHKQLVSSSSPSSAKRKKSKFSKSKPKSKNSVNKFFSDYKKTADFIALKENVQNYTNNLKQNDYKVSFNNFLSYLKHQDYLNQVLTNQIEKYGSNPTFKERLSKIFDLFMKINNKLTVDKKPVNKGDIDKLSNSLGFLNENEDLNTTINNNTAVSTAA